MNSNGIYLISRLVDYQIRHKMVIAQVKGTVSLMIVDGYFDPRTGVCTGTYV